MTDVNSELLEALQRIMEINCPLTGEPTHEQLVEFWEYEKTQGRGEADDQLFALAAVAKARGGSDKKLRSFLDAAAKSGITHLPGDFGEKLAAASLKPLTDEQIEAGRRTTFSTDNPFCPCDSKTMRKAVRWAEKAHGITGAKP